ncbi:uncharacterized protein LOC143776071 isoform X2 [Ranitomeya variabilis]|uniref:uncharacterized protein LOC143776071 isoform X2 n=1 Tax=Ranitomeya variabilis TaxID=490064 RepID=UPI004056A6C1
MRAKRQCAGACQRALRHFVKGMFPILCSDGAGGANSAGDVGLSGAHGGCGDGPGSLYCCPPQDSYTVWTSEGEELVKLQSEDGQRYASTGNVLDGITQELFGDREQERLYLFHSPSSVLSEVRLRMLEK